jgi:hypothetical protein
MFATAKYPARVFVGAYEQNDDMSESCMPAMKNAAADAPSPESVAAKYAENVRVKTVPASEASGPCTARYQCSMLMRDEEIFLQIDSHTIFAQDWDLSAVQMLQEVPGAQNGSVVISTYPADCDCDNNWVDSDPPVIDQARFSGSQIIFGATIRGDARTRDAPSRQIGGGFLLCVADVVRRVPFDPGLPGVFQGEEILHSARMYTAGIDIVAPRKNLVCHKYSNNPDHRTVWADNPRWADGAKGPARVDSLLLGKNEGQFGPYGMGRVRSLDDFWQHTQIDYEKKTVGNWQK